MPETLTEPVVALDWAKIDAYCLRSGADTELARSRLLGTGRTTLWRWRQGKADVGLIRAGKLASRLGLLLTDILTDPKPPTPPPPQPRPPAGPQDPRPPAGPKRADQ